MNRIMVLAIVGLSLTTLNCGGLYSTCCGGKAVMKSAVWWMPDHGLRYESAECRYESELQDARARFRQPDTTVDNQYVYIDIDQATWMDGIYEMIILKNGSPIRRVSSGKPFMQGTTGNWRVSMGVSVPKYIELPLEVVVVHANGKRVLHYIIEPLNSNKQA